MDKLNVQLKNALPDLPHPSSKDYESARLRNELLKHERLKQVSECENRISNFKTEMEKRKKQLLEKAKTKEHVNMILYEFNKPDYTYIQLLENLYKVKNQMVVKTRSEILSEMQSVLENLLF
jgi:uncharacterized small protein (DUF1192 family)